MKKGTYLGFLAGAAVVSAGAWIMSRMRAPEPVDGPEDETDLGDGCRLICSDEPVTAEAIDEQSAEYSWPEAEETAEFDDTQSAQYSPQPQQDSPSVFNEWLAWAQNDVEYGVPGPNPNDVSVEPGPAAITQASPPSPSPPKKSGISQSSSTMSAAKRPLLRRMNKL